MGGGGPTSCYRQHTLAEIQRGHLRASSRQTQREVASTTAEIQRPLTGLRAGQLDHPPFPMPVQAKALEVIYQVIVRRDAGEKVVHLRRALFAWIEKPVAHGCACEAKPGSSDEQQRSKDTKSKRSCPNPVSFGECPFQRAIGRLGSVLPGFVS